MNSYWLGIIGAVATVLFVFEMLRRGILKERFAALWLVVSAILLLVAVFPRILESAADLFGVEVAANLLFFVSIIFLLLVAVQLSFEISRLEARTRRLAEDLALLRWEVRGGSSLRGHGGDGGDAATTAGGSTALQPVASRDQSSSPAPSATAQP